MSASSASLSRRAPRSSLANTSWVLVCAFVVVLPLALVGLQTPARGRSVTAELGSATGIIALSLLGLLLVLPSRVPIVARTIGADVAVRLHRRLARVAVVVIVTHVLIVVLAQPARIALLEYVGAPWRAQAAIGSVIALACLIATATWRKRLHLPYAFWRGLHLGLGALALALAAVHTIGVGRYLTHGLAAVWFALFTVGCLAALAELRLVKPRRLVRDRYVVQDVLVDPGGATTIKLEAKGHYGRAFRPGQFAWLKLSPAAGGLVEHPFSYSSSALTPARPWFTIKPYGKFTQAIRSLSPGSEVLLDGPHGSYLPRPDASGYVLIAGGIGITPSVSLLRTAADLQDSRPYLLLYGNRCEEEIVLAEDLASLPARLNLKVVHVISQPRATWAGERGRINASLLDRHLPADLRGFEFFICAGPGMVAGAVASLVEIGVAPEHIHTESF